MRVATNDMQARYGPAWHLVGLRVQHIQYCLYMSLTAVRLAAESDPWFCYNATATCKY